MSLTIDAAKRADVPAPPYACGTWETIIAHS
jgi:hypothetical protein